jgi:hypothetical protein
LLPLSSFHSPTRLSAVKAESVLTFHQKTDDQVLKLIYVYRLGDICRETSVFGISEIITGVVGRYRDDRHGAHLLYVDALTDDELDLPEKLPSTKKSEGARRKAAPRDRRSTARKSKDN